MTIKNMDENLDHINEFMKSNVVLRKDYVILEHINDGVETTTMIKYEIIHRQTHMSMNNIIKELAKFDYITKMDLITELEKI